MKFRRTLFSLIAFFCVSQLLHADILILKNGEKKEGNILEERPDAVRMKYHITPKIMDEKDFPRADIAQIIKQKPEEIEILELRKVLPTPDLLPADAYEQIIQDKLRPFVNKYPGTEQAKEVEGMVAELQKEKDKVVSGQGKVEGVWLTAEMMRRDDYNVRAYKLRRSMLAKAAAQDYTGAMKEFDRLQDAENGFPASLQYLKAIPEVIDIMTKYDAQITRMISEQPILQKQRDDSLKKLVDPDLTRTKMAVDKEKNAWMAQFEAEKKAKIKWQTLYKYDLKSLQEALRLVVSERGKLQLIDLARLQAQNEALTKALRYLADENVVEADNALKAAKQVTMPEASRLVSSLVSRIAALRQEQLKNKSINRSFGQGSSAIAGNSAAIQDDRVAQAMAAAEKAGEAKKPDAEKKPGTETTSEPEKKPETPASGKSKAKQAPKPAPASAPVVAPAPVEEDSGMTNYLMIAAGVLIVVLIVAFLMQKKKGK